MTELDSGHQFVKAYSCIFPYQKVLSKLSFKIFLLQKLYKITKHRPVKCFSNKISLISVFLKILQGEDFFSLKLIKIFVYYWGFYCLILCKISFFEVIILNDFFWVPFTIIQIMNTMTKSAIFSIVNTQTPQIISTKRSLFWCLYTLVLYEFDNIFLDLLLSKVHIF